MTLPHISENKRCNQRAWYRTDDPNIVTYVEVKQTGEIHVNKLRKQLAEEEENLAGFPLYNTDGVKDAAALEFLQAENQLMAEQRSKAEERIAKIRKRLDIIDGKAPAVETL